MKKLGILILMTFLLIASVSAITMTRTVSSTALPGSTFTVTYTVSGAIGGWGASIIDNVAGGCKFPGGVTQLKTVMLSVDGATKSVTVTAPSSSGTCTFTGDYKFGIDPIVNFATATTTISGTCTPNCAGKECGDNGCGGSCGTCSSGTCSNGLCVTTCPYGQTRCPDGICKATCEAGGGYSIWVIVLIIAVVVGILWFVFRKKKQ